MPVKRKFTKTKHCRLKKIKKKFFNFPFSYLLLFLLKILKILSNKCLHNSQLFKKN